MNPIITMGRLLAISVSPFPGFPTVAPFLFLFFSSLLFILVSAYKLARSQFSLSTSVNRISIFIVFLNYLLDNI